MLLMMQTRALSFFLCVLIGMCECENMSIVAAYGRMNFYDGECE